MSVGGRGEKEEVRGSNRCKEEEEEEDVVSGAAMCNNSRKSAVCSALC